VFQRREINSIGEWVALTQDPIRTIGHRCRPGHLGSQFLDHSRSVDDKSDQKVLDNFNELFRNSRAAVAKHKGERGEGDEMMVEAYLKKAAKGQFGEKIFNELKEIFTKPSAVQGGASRPTRP
jgi:hypothetical protein